MKLFKKRNEKIISFLLALLVLFTTVCGAFSPSVVYAQEATVNTDRLNLRSGPGTSYSKVTTLSAGTKVNVLESVNGSDGKIWYKVSSQAGDGYLRSDFLSLDLTYNAADTDFEAYLTDQGFPESYKNALRGLHAKYPNWVFVAQHTGLSWEAVLTEESKIGTNLVYTDNISSWKSLEDGAFDWAGNYWPGFDGSVWVAASKEIIAYYLDPRNFLSDPYIFQFQNQTYDPSLQTRDGLSQMVKGTFLDGTVNQTATGVSTGSEESYGPGFVNQTDKSDSIVTGPAPGSTSSGESSNGPVSGNLAVLEESLFEFFGGITAEANWQKEEEHWIYLNSDGSRNVSGWFWLDGNNDGVSECYYFDENGVMASDTVINGYQINSNGQWIKDGCIQTKSETTAKNTEDNTYVSLLMEAAEQSGVSPYVLAAMIIQEQGTDGTSPMISGTNSAYYGYYNFYNIGAYEHDGMSAVEAGLKYASESGNGDRPWNTVKKGIVGGACAYGANFTDAGQDTFYLKKFNVQGDNKFNHQYMTNVEAAAEEGSQISKAYTDEIKCSALVFKIPVYTDMPENPCSAPTKSGNPNNKLSALSVNGFTVTPTFQMNVSNYSLIVENTVESVTVYASAIDQSAVVDGIGTKQLGVGTNNFSITVTAENGDTREYRLTVTRKEGNSENTGPRTSETGPGTAETVSGNSNTGTAGPVSGTNNSSSSEPKIEICGPPM